MTPRVTEIERFVLDVPFRERVAPWNALLISQHRVVEVVRVQTDDPDVVGWGETLPHYTWGRVSDHAVRRATGRPLAELAGDDTLGCGLQMAVYDALGKALGEPVWRLLGRPRARNWCPLAWWSTKMPPEALAEEAAEALAQGYTAHKIKARPWFDVYAQIEAISKVTPPYYHVEPDFNDMLLHAGTAAPVLQTLDGYERVALYEGPLPQRDVAGYRHLRAKTNRPLVIHFGLPDFPTVVRSEMCDGFVVSGGVAGVLRRGTLADAFDMPYFLQMTGTGLTTALCAHLGAVLPGARWPAVTCLNNYADDLLTEPLTIRDGCIRVPDAAPGLGVSFDETVLTKFALSPPHRLPQPRHILTVSWPGGRKMHYPYMERDTLDSGDAHYSHLKYAATPTTGAGCWEDFLRGNQPVFERGVRLDVWDDDGSPEWADLYARTLEGPVRG